MKLNLLLALVMVSASAERARAAGDHADAGCRGSTVDVMECLEKALKPWDQRLNTAYQAALNASESPARKDGLIHAERAWLAYRTANCGWYAAQPGTIREILAPQCRLDMTRSRALELEDSLAP